MSRLSRRQVVIAGLASSALPLASRAQNYPARPVRFIVPAAAGGNADIVARMLGDVLARNMGQPVIVDNRPGASTTIGTNAAAKSAPDGYTVLLFSNSQSVAPITFGKELPYDTQKDLVAVTKMTSTPMVLVAHPGLGVSSVRELIAKAKAEPGKINFSSSGTGSPGHLAGELLNSLAGIRTTHIPYKGTAQSINDAASGEVQLSYPSLPSVAAMIQSGKLRALGITSSRPNPAAPDIVPIAATVPGYETTIWTGLVAPAGVPKPVLSRLHAEFTRVLGSAEIRSKLAGIGVDVETSTPEEFDAFIDAEINKWTRVIREGNVKMGGT